MKFIAIIQANLKQLLFVFLAFFLMVLVSYFFAAGIVDNQVSSNAEKVFRTAETFVYSNVREAELVLLNTALAVQNKLDDGKSTEDIQAYIEELTGWMSMPEYAVSGIMNIQGYIRGTYIDGRGRPPADNVFSPGRHWPSGVTEAAGGIVRGVPHIDPRSGRLIISFSKSLEGKDGTGYGLISITMDMAVIADYVKQLQFAEGGYGMLVNQDLVFITHPDEDNLNRPMAEVSLSHADIVRHFTEGRTEIPAARVTTARGALMILSFRRLFTGWYMGVATPIASYYHGAYLMAVVLSLLGLVFMIVLSFFLIRLGMEKIQSDEENKSKSSFLARMSHEIRTPMNSILGMTELIMRKNTAPEIGEYISIINQAGHTLLAIINDILDFSKITSGQVKIETRKYRFASLINDTINVIRMRLLEKPLDFLVTVDANIPAELTGDDVRVRQILINLLNNAIKYTPSGHIALDIQYKAVDIHAMELIITVRDTGIGIKREDMEHLFSDFTRLDMQNNQGIEGTGLGLAITRTLCTAMGGSITVSSQYGAGSVFTVTLPQGVEDTTKLARVDAPEKRRVLLFDERPVILASIQSSFANLNIQPVCPGTLSGFIAELEKGNHEYAFVSSRHALDCIHGLGRSNSPTQLVIMVELGDISIFREVKSVMMPVYSLPIANALNNVFDADYPKRREDGLNFTAPAARVLIVDDISSNLRVAQELMAFYKMEIHTCQSGAEAVEKVKQNYYDLVFMDQMMPGMDGLEAAAAIRAWEEEAWEQRSKKTPSPGSRKNVPIIALTANAISGQREMFLEKGLDDFLSKPIEIKQLNSLLEHWIPAEKKNKSSPKAKDVPGEADTITAIAGLDTALGLTNVNGEEAIYRDILDEFCRDLDMMIDRVREARAKDSMELLAEVMHAIKGASRSVGALDLGNMAEDLEREAKRGAINTVEEKTGALLAVMEALGRNINTALSASNPRDESQEPTDLSLLRLETLKEALLDMNVETVNRILVEYLSIPMDHKTKEHIAKIEENVLMFEYEMALAEIDKLLS
jgi:signal transduction histidine kinase/CheY-like chemotaxis protein/HPt (histidine-containing phosphotransfer) domain-containing protein